MVNAVANSVVPKFTIVIGNSYGAGNYAMCGKAYDPRLIVAWPSAKIAVMGGDQAAKTLAQIQVATMKSKGKEVSAETAREVFADFYDHMKEGDIVSIEVYRPKKIGNKFKKKTLKARARKIKITEYNKISIKDDISDKEKLTLKSWIGM